MLAGLLDDIPGMTGILTTNPGAAGFRAYTFGVKATGVMAFVLLALFVYAIITVLWKFYKVVTGKGEGFEVGNQLWLARTGYERTDRFAGGFNSYNPEFYGPISRQLERHYRENAVQDNSYLEGDMTAGRGKNDKFTDADLQNSMEGM